MTALKISQKKGYLRKKHDLTKTFNFFPGSSIGSLNSTTAEQKITLVFFLGGITYAEIAALRFLAQQDDGKKHV